jgi:signal transduction histidine kinase
MERASLQAVLELAGAVCHEFNQPLQVIYGGIELLRFQKNCNAEFHESLDRIQRQVERLGALTRKLGRITRRETREYAGGVRILDLDRSAPDGVDPLNP